MELSNCRRFLAIILLFFSISLDHLAFAFKPTAEFGHVGIVRDALTPITRSSSSGETLKFSPRAINQVRTSTAAVDNFTGSGEFSVPEAHCDDELLAKCTQRIIDIKKTIIGLLKDEANRDGEKARKETGRALHTLQDFYSHSNWVNNPGPNNTSFNSALGRSTLTALPVTTATCEDDRNDGTLIGAGLSSITTGYFSLLPGGEPPKNKCSHGKFLGAGIHKDAPGRPFHTEARASAVSGTVDFINQILDAPEIAGNDDAVRAFMDVKGTLGFIIDDTGSMGTVVGGVSASVNRIVNSVLNTDNQPDNFLLVRFGDPNVGAPFITTDASELLNRVNAINVRGGDDCPELSQSGLLKAIGASNNDSKLFLYTDASAKDAGLAGNVAAAASSKNITVNYIVSGSCSPVDPVYFQVAQETGGQVFFVPGSETESVFNLIEPSLSGDLQLISIINDSIVSGETKQINTPVDSSITQLSLAVAVDLLSSVNISTPSGVTISSTDANVTITDLPSSKIITIDNPEDGEWRLSIQGSGNLSVSISGNSDLAFDDFSFVEIRGRAEHEGYFPLEGQPILGCLLYTSDAADD